jgi:signal transduction histidine kinase
MDAVGKFLADNSFLISFMNGLTFFVLGISIALESSRARAPEQNNHLTLLSWYGFMACFANWVRVYILTHVHASHANDIFMEVARLVCLVLAAAFLLQFATQRLASTNPHYRILRWALPLLSLVFALLVWARLAAPDALETDWISAADVYSRYILLFPGLTLSALAMWAERRRFLAMGLPHIARDTLGVSVSFAAKAIASGLVAFPVFGSPPQGSPTMILILRVVRMVAALSVTYFMVRSLRFFEIERRRQLDTALRQQLQAQEQTLEAQQQARLEVERWSGRLEDLVNSIASAISKPAEIKDVLNVSLSKVLELTAFDAGHICLVQRGGRPELRLTTHIGLPLQSHECKSCLRLDQGMQGGIHSSDAIVVISNLDQSPDLAESPCAKSGFRSLVSVPVSNRGSLLGIMHLLSKNNLEPAAHELGVLSAIGQQIGVAIENARLYEEVQNLAAVEERERIGRELHDGLAQVLGYLYLKSHTVAGLLASGRLDNAQTELNELREATREAQRDVRESILGLRTSITPGTGVISTLAEYVSRFSQQSGVNATLVVGNEDSIEFTPTVEIQLLRVVQEALTNVRKHAAARRACVSFEADGDLMAVTIKDDGRGFDVANATQNGHFGLHTMKERAEGVGGDFRISAEPGRGTTVIVRLPFTHNGGK